MIHEIVEEIFFGNLQFEFDGNINFTLRRVNTRFLGPMQQPLIMTKSCLTNP